MDQATTVTTIPKGDQGNPKSGRTGPRTRLGGDKPRSPPTRSRDPLAPPRRSQETECCRGGGGWWAAGRRGVGEGSAGWGRRREGAVVEVGRMRAGRQELGLEFGREGRSDDEAPAFLCHFFSLAFRFIISIINNNEVLYLRGIPWIWSSGCLTRLAAKGTSSNSKASRLLSLFGHFQCRHSL
jgi:hypothetical protein